jgi:hypothetical protein
MFVLVFLVMFGPKKGFVKTYSSGWDAANLLSKQAVGAESAPKKNIIRYQFTIITSRLTSYMLFSFWIFFFFFGESLLLIMLNYTTVVDSINSHSFFIIKQHIIFYLNTGSSYLLTQINFFIYFLTSSSILYLINLNFRSQYWLFRHTYLVNVLLFPLVWILYVIA